MNIKITIDDQVFRLKPELTKTGDSASNKIIFILDFLYKSVATNIFIEIIILKTFDDNFFVRFKAIAYLP